MDSEGLLQTFISSFLLISRAKKTLISSYPGYYFVFYR